MFLSFRHGHGRAGCLLDQESVILHIADSVELGLRDKMRIRDFVMYHQFCLNELTFEYGDSDKPRDQPALGAQGN